MPYRLFVNGKYVDWWWNMEEAIYFGEDYDDPGEVAEVKTTDGRVIWSNRRRQQNEQRNRSKKRQSVKHNDGYPR